MPETTPRTIAVVGTGVAGATAALTLRQEGFDGRILLVGEEPHPPYRRPPLSKDFLKPVLTPERLRLKPPTVWQELGIELRTGTQVTGITDGALECADANRVPYDRLLLATGGRARALPYTAGHDHVHTLRGLSDVPALRADLDSGGPLLVIGAGLVGLEVAARARSAGLDVIVLEAEAEPLRRVLPAPVRRAVLDLHRAHGTQVHTGVALTGLARRDGMLVATARDGRSWHAHTVLVAAGMRPDIELAARAGLDVGDGILVDALGTTSDPRIFAAGDVALYPDPVLGRRVRVEQWNHAQQQGAAVARNMLGAGTPFTAVPWSWTDQYRVMLQIAGHCADADSLTVQGDIADFDFAALATANGRPVGAVAAGRPHDFRALRTVLDHVDDSPSPATVRTPAVTHALLAGGQPQCHVIRLVQGEPDVPGTRIPTPPHDSTSPSNARQSR
ncbi:NAD(P)/FAD-dependent oxidoreductase [Streptomyces canus]|uniref:NAD(P)/FAD-dependent oxidoreductase n=1 Tax=Streptomyces canus TaxID=58343 RepID=UPI002257ECE9|nr:FAD-dependent oxidoreductase [Streptomyces canus]MCX4862099.1 FAD-dependent oxidoreductase [Streptomyces canus]